jgi:hypothetical protein
MNIQQLRLPAANVKVIGRPPWQVSLRASIQRGRKRLKAMLCASVLKHCASCEPQALGRAA